MHKTLLIASISLFVFSLENHQRKNSQHVL